jgi:para-aminobenzoate synthetase/4-amino-4-deoxychorismate lyase
MPVELPKAQPRTWHADVRLGVFETLLVLDGRPVELAAHTARLQASLTELFPGLAHPGLDRVLAVDRPCEGPAAGVSAEALRIAVAPGAGGELAVTTERRPASGNFAPENGGKVTTRASSLRSLRVAGGLGEHKWADRSLLDEAQVGLPDGALPLIVDADGAVLEASRANLFAVREGALFTPPLDGRILPGITRGRAIELARSIGLPVREEALDRDGLRGAGEVFLTGSVRGIEGAAALDGAALSGAGPVAARLDAALQEAWARSEAASSALL